MVWGGEPLIAEGGIFESSRSSMAMDWAILRAHTNGPGGEVDSLQDHLTKTASMAGEFANVFGCGDTASLMGILHDAGKARADFQEYLARLDAGEKLSHGPPHSVWGAALAYLAIYKKGSATESWKEVCVPVAGHHGGLAAAGELALRLEELVRSEEEELRRLGRGLLRLLPKRWENRALPAEPASREFRVRMLSSALTDADYLATERHFSPEKSPLRTGWPKIGDLWDRFIGNQTRLLERVSEDGSLVNAVRREVYECCLEAAAEAPGLFRLTVPTGGGKTRSGLGFALRHAREHGLHRVVVAVPYTSITDQTAREYRAILGADAVLEHHSQVPEHSGEEQSPEVVRARMATENWDAPVIVTTTVQLFESMFANRPGEVRKLHNLAKAVIILDEVQALPNALLETTVDGIQTLAREYGASVVFCTATQPALDGTPYLKGFSGLPVRDIVPAYRRHFAKLRRVEYEMPPTPVSWTELAEEVRDQQQVLVILNTRRDASALLEELKDAEGLCHLSGLLCGAHRRKVLACIKRGLKYGKPVRAICTQVVEAGVDLDFPVVYRALGPLDRVVQAAGRCNREGKKTDGPGRVIIFEPREGGAPRGNYRTGIEQAKLLLDREGAAGLHRPDVYTEYFQRLFAHEDLDKHKIQQCRMWMDFPETAHRYRFIEETVSAVAPFGKAGRRLRRWQREPSRAAWRALQPYVISFFLWEAKQMEADGRLEQLGEGLYRWLGEYDRIRGAVVAARDPSDLIVWSGSRDWRNPWEA